MGQLVSLPDLMQKGDPLIWLKYAIFQSGVKGILTEDTFENPQQWDLGKKELEGSGRGDNN